MKEFKSFGAFGAHLQRLALEGPAVKEHLLDRWGEHVRDDAKSRIGTYQDGWKELEDSTVAEKTRLGYSPEDNPLLRDGTMRDSIGYLKGDGEVVVGSPSIIAFWQEIGTSKMAPRPFIGPAAHVSETWFEAQAGLTLMAWISGIGWKRVRPPK